MSKITHLAFKVYLSSYKDKKTYHNIKTLKNFEDNITVALLQGKKNTVWLSHIFRQNNTKALTNI